MVFLTFLLITNCAKEEDKKPAIKIETVRGPEANPVEDCGGFSWDVTYTLDEASPKGGWFVQKVIFKTDHDPCKDPKVSVEVTYWEAWEVKAGKKIENERDQGNYDYDDRYWMPDRPNHKGVNSITGELNFFEGLTLPDDFKANNPKTYAGGLRATTTKPAFWKDKNNLDHSITVTWNCCDTTGKTKKITSVPEVPVNKPAPEPTSSTFNPLAQEILKITPWTDDYTEKDQMILKEVSNNLAFTPAENLSISFQQILNAFVGTNVETQELSKIYLFLRAIYNLPTLPIDNAKVFGGWIHPDVNSAIFNLSYPVNIDVEVAGPFSGFIGREYDPIAELEYFEKNFPRRGVSE